MDKKNKVKRARKTKRIKRGKTMRRKTMRRKSMRRKTMRRKYRKNKRYVGGSPGDKGDDDDDGPAPPGANTLRLSLIEGADELDEGVPVINEEDNEIHKAMQIIIDYGFKNDKFTKEAIQSIIVNNISNDLTKLVSELQRLKETGELEKIKIRTEMARMQRMRPEKHQEW